MTKRDPGNVKKSRRARDKVAFRSKVLTAPTAPRKQPVGPISFPTKKDDPDTRRLIDEALERRSVGEATPPIEWRKGRTESGSDM